MTKPTPRRVRRVRVNPSCSISYANTGGGGQGLRVNPNLTINPCSMSYANTGRGHELQLREYRGGAVHSLPPRPSVSRRARSCSISYANTGGGRRGGQGLRVDPNLRIRVTPTLTPP